MKVVTLEKSLVLGMAIRIGFVLFESFGPLFVFCVCFFLLFIFWFDV